jgi:hypothetical protein
LNSVKDRNYKFHPNLGTLNSLQNDSKQIQQHSQVHRAKLSVSRVMCDQEQSAEVIGLGLCKYQLFQLDCTVKIPKLNSTRVESIVVVNL